MFMLMLYCVLVQDSVQLILVLFSCEFMFKTEGSNGIHSLHASLLASFPQKQF